MLGKGEGIHLSILLVLPSFLPASLQLSPKLSIREASQTLHPFISFTLHFASFPFSFSFSSLSSSFSFSFLGLPSPHRAVSERIDLRSVKHQRSHCAEKIGEEILKQLLLGR